MRLKIRYRRSAFTLIELLVVIAIIGLLVTIIAPSVDAARILALRTRCASNMREVGRSCVAYGNDGRYHRGNLVSALPSNAPTTGNWGNMSAGNPGSLWLLLKFNYLSGNVMLCPEGKNRQVPKLSAPVAGDTAFTTSTYSYSYLSQVPTADGYSETSIEDAGSSLIVAADRNPRCTPGNTTIGSNNNENSKNHNSDGQNVARLDQSSKWITSPTDNNDDIYAAESGGSDSQGKRKDISDSFLLP